MKNTLMRPGMPRRHPGERQVAPGRVLRRTSIVRRAEEKDNQDVTALGKEQVEQWRGRPQLPIGGEQGLQLLKKSQKMRSRSTCRSTW